MARGVLPTAGADGWWSSGYRRRVGGYDAVVRTLELTLEVTDDGLRVSYRLAGVVLAAAAVVARLPSVTGGRHGRAQ